MEEVFAEYIVKRKMSTKSMIYRIFAVIGILLGILSFAFLGALSVAISALLFYLAWYVFTITSVEYEYSVVNSELVIEKIMGQRKRKRIAEYDFKQAEIMAYKNSKLLDGYNGNMKVYDYSSHTDSDAEVGVIFRGKEGNFELIFEPNERIIEAVRRIRPGIVKID